jgi:hypothetical protein
MAIINNISVESITPWYLLTNSIEFELIPQDKGLIGQTSICNKQGESCEVELKGYVTKYPDCPALQKIHLWARVAGKTAAYAEVVVETKEMKFYVEHQPHYPTPFQIAPEFKKHGIGSCLLRVVGELALDFRKMCGKKEIVIQGQVVATMEQEEVAVLGMPAHFGRWYALGGRAGDPHDHRKIVEELKKPNKDRNWYLHLPSRGRMRATISQDRLMDSLKQKTAICYESCWSRLPIYDIAVMRKQQKMT